MSDRTTAGDNPSESLGTGSPPLRRDRDRLALDVRVLDVRVLALRRWAIR